MAVQSLKGFGQTPIPEEIKPKWEDLPLIERKILVSRIGDRIVKYFKDPENVRKFEEWKEQRKAAEALAGASTAESKQVAQTERIEE